MPRAFALLLAFLPAPTLHAQSKHTTIPMGDALTKALAQSALTSPGAEPFHLVLSISEPENPQSPYQATLEEWWSSDKEWRREITSPPTSLKQVVVMHDGLRSEAWPLNSDNAGLEDPARDQVRKWKLKVATGKDGRPVQVDGGVGFAFETRIGDPLPELTDTEVRALATHIVEPVWPADGLHHGDVIDVTVSVSEMGKLTGASFQKAPPAAQGAIMDAVRQWTFKPLERDGHPQYFHGTIRFVVP